MNGNPVGEATILVTSPRVKQIVITITKPRIALIAKDHIMDFGRVSPASLTSSAMDTAVQH